eukprot:6101593-Alexandrium_andersonii.AAC.1
MTPGGALGQDTAARARRRLPDPSLGQARLSFARKEQRGPANWARRAWKAPPSAQRRKGAPSAIWRPSPRRRQADWARHPLP